MANGKLICEQHVKEFIKLKAERLRPEWDCRQVSQEALDVIEAKLRIMIVGAVKAHPTRGKTFRQVI